MIYTKADNPPKEGRNFKTEERKASAKFRQKFARASEG